MIVVLDVSAAVEVLLHRGKAERLGAALADAEWVLAPSLYTAELCNVMWKYHQFHALAIEDCEKAIARGLALPDTFTDDLTLQREAFALACQCRRPVYDMLYLVLARRQSAHLLTLDKPLKTLAGQQGIRTL